MQAINVLDYGAVADWNGKTGTDNFGAFLQAMDQAATLGVPLRVPAGKYYIVPQGPAPQIKPGEKVFVFGDGPEQTMIKFGPAPDQTTGFYVRAGGDLTLE